MRLKLVRDTLSLSIFKWANAFLALSFVMMVASAGAFFTKGLNFGIDFRGGTTIRTETTSPVDVASYRDALGILELGDVSITEVFDPSFRGDQHVAMVRISSQNETASVTPETLDNVLAALQGPAPDIRFISVESVGPKVSGELIMTAVKAVIWAIVVVLIYIWFRFEWQYSVGAVAALIHDVTLTIGVFALLQIKFDLAIIAALLTIVGYSLNDTVVVFDRIRENLLKHAKKDVPEVVNLSINETMSRTLMTSVTTLIALLALFIWGGDVIRGFVFAMTWGVIVGTYSSVFVASTSLLKFGVTRSWQKKAPEEYSPYAGIDA